MNPTSSNSQQSNSPELTALVAEFRAWRAQRSSRRTPVPHALRRKALALLEICRSTHIIKALGINHTILKTWQNEEGDLPAQAAFVPLTLPAESAPVCSSPAALTIANGLGQQVILQGGFSAAQLALVVQALSERIEEVAP